MDGLRIHSKLSVRKPADGVCIPKLAVFKNSRAGPRDWAYLDPLELMIVGRIAPNQVDDINEDAEVLNFVGRWPETFSWGARV